MAILMLIYEYSANAQTTIVGKVVDASTEEPLIGASVTYTAGKGTITDIDGAYKLTLNKGTYNFTVSYIGYQTIVKEIKVTGGSLQTDFRLDAENASLSAVTVVAEMD